MLIFYLGHDKIMMLACYLVINLKYLIKISGFLKVLLLRLLEVIYYII